MLNVQFYSVCVIFSIHFLLNATQGIKTFFKSGFVMVAHDIIHFGVGDVSAKISQMIKSLSAFGVGRSLIFREKLPMKTSMPQVLLLRSMASMSTLERQKIL